MHCVKLPLNSGEVWSLAGVLLPTLLHDAIHVVRAAVRCVHSVALLYMLCHIFDRLEEGEREGGRDGGREDKGRREGKQRTG